LSVDLDRQRSGGLDGLPANRLINEVSRHALTGTSKAAAARAEIGGDLGERPIGEECSQRGLNYERFRNLELAPEVPNALAQL
jgi:hypothetical protein